MSIPGINGSGTANALKALQRALEAQQERARRQQASRTQRPMGATDAFERTRPKNLVSLKPEPPGVNGPAGLQMNEGQKYDYYKTIIQQHGKFDEDPGKRNLIAFRQHTDYYANYGKGQYDDTMAMLWKDKDGSKHVRMYHANTEPNYATEGAATDVNGDGRKDPARIPVGQYKYTFRQKDSPLVGGEHSGAFHAVGNKPWWGLGLKEESPFNVDRDTRHDQSFSTSTGGSNGGWNVEIHASHEGNDFWTQNPQTKHGGTGVGSAGCVSVPNSEFKQLVQDMGGQKDLRFTVVNQGGADIPLEAPPQRLQIPDAPQSVKDAWEKERQRIFATYGARV